ncbi:VOC family protein [Shimia ponticola]|uniref:VOC family protein n=1 Tax=Shimia ponticola TaxID=2582893 RepID=UPI002103050F|nr:VOC family protein [Shimia ponticola]
MSGSLITGIDHIVLTVRDVEATVSFFQAALGVEAVTFAGTRRALIVGDQKINLQTLGQETRNHAVIGSGDVCLLTDAAPGEVITRVEAAGGVIVEGPVAKSGARGPITSVYFNDLDGNLIEVSRYE